MRSQSAIASGRHDGRRTPPYAFTEHGALMAANVLRSERAIEMSVFVVRAFVSLRGMLTSQTEMLRKLEELEECVGAHDEAIQSIVSAIRRLMAPSSSGPKIGFTAEDGADRLESVDFVTGKTVDIGRASAPWRLDLKS